MILRAPLPLTLRILRYLEALREPCHYLVLSDVLHRPADRVGPLCCHLTNTGSLKRTRRGWYAITERGIAASQEGIL